MGYDRAITIFSPDGTIYQVDYAFEAVKKGWTTLALKTKAGVAIIVEKRRVSPLIDLDGIEKIFVVDEHIGASFAGLAADGRVLIDYARQMAMQHRLIYDEPVSVDYLTKTMCDLLQAYTQHGGVRPFGVAVIMAGIDRKVPKLYMTEPSGQYLSYSGLVIGSGGQVGTEYLEKAYTQDLDTEGTIILGLKTLQSTLKPGEKITPQQVEIGFANVQTGLFRKLLPEEKSYYVSKIS
jgi:proteasome alpha subunit